VIPQQGIHQVVAAVVENRERRRIILFGACAMGDSGRGQDVDLFVTEGAPALLCRRTGEVQAPFREDCSCAMDVLVFLSNEA